MYTYLWFLLAVQLQKAAAAEDLEIRDLSPAFERVPTASNFVRRAFHGCA